MVVTGFPPEVPDDLDPEVERLLEELEAAYERWEAKIADKERDHFEAAYGGVEAVGDRDGGLESLWLSPDLNAYPHLEVERRLNKVFGSLRDAAMEANPAPAAEDLL